MKNLIHSIYVHINDSEPEVQLSCVKQCCAVLCSVRPTVVQSHLSLDAETKQRNKQRTSSLNCLGLSGSWKLGLWAELEIKCENWGLGVMGVNGSF